MARTRERLAEDLLVIVDGEATGVDLDPEEAALLADAVRRPSFEGWADIELMGHRTRVAHVRELEIAHRGFLELTWRKGEVECREIYSPTAVFCLTPLEDEEQARKLLEAREDIPF